MCFIYSWSCFLLVYGYIVFQFSSVQSLSRVQFFATPWITARQASLSITNSRSLLKLIPIKSVMPSSHLILCRLRFLFPFSPKGGVTCISEVINVSPSSLDSSLCFIQPCISPDVLCIYGFPRGSDVKESACNVGDLGSIPGLGRCPREGKCYPLPYSGLENSMSCIVHEVTKSRTLLSDFHFHFLHSAYKLNKQDGNIQPWRTAFPIWNQSIVTCPVLIVASWAYRFLRRQVMWSDISISWRIFHSLLWSTQSN